MCLLLFLYLIFSIINILFFKKPKIILLINIILLLTMHTNAGEGEDGDGGGGHGKRAQKS